MNVDKSKIIEALNYWVGTRREDNQEYCDSMNRLVGSNELEWLYTTTQNLYKRDGIVEEEVFRVSSGLESSRILIPFAVNKYDAKAYVNIRKNNKGTYHGYMPVKSILFNMWYLEEYFGADWEEIFGGMMPGLEIICIKEKIPKGLEFQKIIL